MKKHWMMSLFGASALALTLIACGDTDRLRGPETTPPAPPPGTSGEEQPPSGRTFELRVRGTSVEGFTSLRLPISEVSVTTPEGAPLPVRLETNVLGLASANHSPLLANFDVPEGVERVRITLHFAATGEFDRNGRHEKLDTRGAPLTFEAKVSDLAVRGRAVLALDMAHSLVPFASSTVLLPSGVLQH